MNRTRMIHGAKHEIPADLVIKNGRIVNVFTKEVLEGDVAIVDGSIVGIGTYEGLKTIDAKGQYLIPGLINAHVHIESSMMTPSGYAGLIAPRGTTTIIADPHEIVNVAGETGLSFMLEDSANLAVDMFFMIPSSVPATAQETNGAGEFSAKDMSPFLDHSRILGLGEVMCIDDVLQAKAHILDKIQSCEGRVIDGHAPGLSGAALQAYRAAGIETDHEAVNGEEAVERLRAGFYLQVREGSAAHDLVPILEAVKGQNLPTERILLCTDDRHSSDIRTQGDMDHCVRLAMAVGYDAITAIQMATINTAQAYGLRRHGAIAPGYQADILFCDDLASFHITAVYKKGKNIQPLLSETKILAACPTLLNSVVLDGIKPSDFAFPVEAGKESLGIEIIPGDIRTLAFEAELPEEDGLFKASKLYSKLAVIERYGKNGNRAVAPIKGYGIEGGAVAMTIAHDSHNIIVCGDNDGDMAVAVEKIHEIQGGIVVVSKGTVLGSLALPVGGLMSTASWPEMEEALTELLMLAHDLGVPETIDPFITLSFMALPVIPEIRLTDQGLVRV
ncbi:Adenine deaminase [Eubacterium aggregans]|uniref:Adenine deaminase n=1 Tax=Eubacterium aggregans TaxID=81409 RepID=A0A1H4B373_9FIRM|nr:adenine deaminase [Eubacterium aggregans]SEA42549.1 Adenine deaminase [Eubacterium aggregans]